SEICPQPMIASRRGAGLLDADEFNVEMQRRVRWDGPPGRAPVPVTELGRDDEVAFLALLHARDALLPALDDLPLAEDEFDRLPAVVRAVELLAVRQLPRVVDLDGLPGFRLRAAAGRLHLVLQAALGRDHLALRGLRLGIRFLLGKQQGGT